MKNDLRIGLAIWRKITNRNFAFAQFFLFDIWVTDGNLPKSSVY